MMSQPHQQAVAINILPKISQSKDFQIIKFDQVIDYKKRNIFEKNIMQKMRQEHLFQISF